MQYLFNKKKKIRVIFAHPLYIYIYWLFPTKCKLIDGLGRWKHKIENRVSLLPNIFTIISQSGMVHFK